MKKPERIPFWFAKLFGKKLGFYHQRLLGPDFYKIEVYDIFGKLYGGDRRYNKYLDSMMDECRHEIMDILKHE